MPTHCQGPLQKAGIISHFRYFPKKKFPLLVKSDKCIQSLYGTVWAYEPTSSMEVVWDLNTDQVVHMNTA